jgi:hypothetical protein
MSRPLCHRTLLDTVLMNLKAQNVSLLDAVLGHNREPLGMSECEETGERSERKKLRALTEASHLRFLYSTHKPNSRF